MQRDRRMQNGAEAATAGGGAFTAAFCSNGRALWLRCYDLAESPCSHFTHTPISPIHRISPISPVSPIGLLRPISATYTSKLRNEPKRHLRKPHIHSVFRNVPVLRGSKRTHFKPIPDLCPPIPACQLFSFSAFPKKSCLIQPNPAKKITEHVTPVLRSPTSVLCPPSGQVRPSPAIQNMNATPKAKADACPKPAAPRSSATLRVLRGSAFFPSSTFHLLRLRLALNLPVYHPHAMIHP